MYWFGESQRRALLSLARCPHAEHHQFASDGKRKFPAKILFDQAEGEIDAGGGARRGEYFSLAGISASASTRTLGYTCEKRWICCQCVVAALPPSRPDSAST